jgi:hypothetical protein
MLDETLEPTVVLPGKVVRGATYIGTVTKQATKMGTTTGGTHYMNFSITIPHVEKGENGYQKPFYMGITLYSKEIDGFRCRPGAHDVVMVSGLRTRANVGKNGIAYVEGVGWGDHIDIISKKGEKATGVGGLPVSSPVPRRSAAEEDDIPF